VGPAGAGGVTGALFMIETATGPTAAVQDGPFEVNQGDTVRFISDNLSVLGQTGSTIISYNLKPYYTYKAASLTTGPNGATIYAMVRSMFNNSVDVTLTGTRIYDINIPDGDHLFSITFVVETDGLVGAGPQFIFEFNFPSDSGINTGVATDMFLPSINGWRLGGLGTTPTIGGPANVLIPSNNLSNSASTINIVSANTLRFTLTDSGGSSGRWYTYTFTWN
jgi:hypothetical protein